MSKNLINDRNLNTHNDLLCIYTNMCKNFDNDYIKNKNREKDDGLFCKKCKPHENSGIIECKNFDPISINEVSKIKEV